MVFVIEESERKPPMTDFSALPMQIEPKAYSTLRNMQKIDLIEYIRCLEHNQNALAQLYENQVRLLEELTKDKTMYGTTEKKITHIIQAGTVDGAGYWMTACGKWIKPKKFAKKKPEECRMCKQCAKKEAAHEVSEP